MKRKYTRVQFLDDINHEKEESARFAGLNIASSEIQRFTDYKAGFVAGAMAALTLLENNVNIKLSIKK